MATSITRGALPAAAARGRRTRLARDVQDGCDAYVYFNNDRRGDAVVNARQLRRYLRTRLGQEAVR